MLLVPLPPVPPHDHVEAFRREYEALPVSQRFTPEQVEGMYAFGRTLLSQGQHEKAAGMFSLLTLYRPLDARMRECYGHCCKGLRQYDTAAAAFLQAAQLTPTEPRPALMAVESLLLLGEHDAAREVLGFVQRMLTGSNDTQSRERSTALFHLLAAPETQA